jgi:hypothetical protein
MPEMLPKLLNNSFDEVFPTFLKRTAVAERKVEGKSRILRGGDMAKPRRIENKRFREELGSVEGRWKRDVEGAATTEERSRSRSRKRSSERSCGAKTEKQKKRVSAIATEREKTSETQSKAKRQTQNLEKAKRKSAKRLETKKQREKATD